MYYKNNGPTASSYTQVIHDGNGEIKRTPFFKDVLKLPVNIEVWELATGVSEGSHTHDGESALEELYFFLEGEGIMWSDGEEFLVSAGDAVLVPEGSEHGFRNTSDGPLKLVILWGKPECTR